MPGCLKESECIDMRIEFHESYILVFREKGDRAFYGIKNAAGESNLLYAIKKVLNSQGYNLIKKRMWKDGHLVDNMQQYLRTQKPSGEFDKDIFISNPRWDIEGAEKMYNQGCVRLLLTKAIFEQE